MTPAVAVGSVLSLARLVAAMAPGPAAGVALRVASVLDGLPDLVEALGDGEWTEADVRALREVLVPMLAEVRGIDATGARWLAGGVAMLTSLVVAAARREDVVSPGVARRRREAVARLRAARETGAP